MEDDECSKLFVATEENSDSDDQQNSEDEDNDLIYVVDDDSDEETGLSSQRAQAQQEEIAKPVLPQPLDAVEKSVSDEEYEELCDRVREKAAKRVAREQCSSEKEDAETDEEELHDAYAPPQQQQRDNIHSDLVTPELSAEEKEPGLQPPKLSHKKSHKKRSPKAEQHKKRGRKLEYQSPAEAVPLHKAIKRKLLPKSDRKPKKEKKKCITKKQQLRERVVHQDGTWVQCMRSGCQKWRYLRDVTDPSLVPEYWVCENNTDPEHNSCDKPEEDYHSLEFVFTKFTEGSIVWAKMHGYPWWPAMVEEDPDTGTYLEQDDTETYPTHYHVVFLDKNVSRTWLKSTSIRKFDDGEDTQTQCKGRDFKQQVGQAVARAKRALSMSVQERIQTFGFSHNFKGKIMDDSQLFAEEDEMADPDSDQEQDEDEEEEDVELDLEMLGLDVDEIPEQAEALLSEAGETIESLQDTSFTHEPTKKKQSKKSKKTADGDKSKAKTGKEGKKEKKCKEKSLEDGQSNKEKKKKMHKSHHHHHHRPSEKGSKEREDGTEAESRDVKDDSTTDGQIVEDVHGKKPKSKKARSKINKDETGDDLPKKTKKPRSEKSSAVSGDQAQNTPAVGETPQVGRSCTETKPKEKKVRKPRVKVSEAAEAQNTQAVDETPRGEKSCSEAKPKEKKVRKPKVKASVALEAPEGSEAQKTQVDGKTPQVDESCSETKPKEKKVRRPRVKTLDTGTESKVKIPRAKKVSATKAKAEGSPKTTSEDSEKLTGKTHATNAPNSNTTSKPKGKKNSTEDETAPKLKPAFRPPSKNVKGTAKTVSFTAPLAKKDDLSTEKEQQEATTKDEAVNDAVIASPDDENVCIKEMSSNVICLSTLQHKTDESDTTANKTSKGDASKAEGKASKVIIKKKTPATSLRPCSKSEELSKTNAGDNTDLSKMSDLTSSLGKPKGKKADEKQAKKATVKKFTIRRQTSPSNSPTGAPAQSASPGKLIDLNNSKDDTPAANIKTPVTEKPRGPTKKSAPKKFSIKRKSSILPEEDTQGNPRSKSGDDDSHQSHPKKAKFGNQKEEVQLKPDVDDEDELHLSPKEGLLRNDIDVAANKQEDRMDKGEDSDDFSMEDLEDWPRDVEIADELQPEGPNKLSELTASRDADSQPFEVVEE